MTKHFVDDVINAWARIGQRPAVTWYSAPGERVELSGSVLSNWLNKTINFLVDEVDAGPGARILIDLPAHWRSMIWALAVWRTGATLLTPSSALPGAADAADAVITAEPAAWSQAGQSLVVAVPLPSLARRFDGELPAGAIDAGPAVMGSADALGYVPSPVASELAIDDGVGQIAYADLASWFGSADADGPRDTRVLVDARGATDFLVAVRQVAPLWDRGNSLVVAADSGMDEARLARVAASEYIERD